MLLLVYIAASIVLLIASYHDIRHRIIPNFLPGAVALLGAVRWLLSGQAGSALWAAGAAAIVLAVTGFMFAQGWIGGGDVKLLTAAVFLLGAPATPVFLVGMALVGGVLALLSVIRLMPGPQTAGEKAVAAAPVSVPYGVAIALSAIAMLVVDYRAGAG